MTRHNNRCFAFVLIITIKALGQTSQPAQTQPGPTRLIESVRPDYELGPGDQLLIGVPQAQEIDQRPFRIDPEGNIDLPLIGKVHAAGLTQRGLETVLTTRLRDYIRQPQLTITITQFRSEPVFFLGAFRTPGLYPLQGGRTLVEMLAVVGGLQPTASRRITITRNAEYGRIDLPGATYDPIRKVSTVQISLDSLTRNVNPAEDIILKAYDMVNAETAQPVFVSGEVVKPGAIAFNEEQTMSITQAITQAGGLTNAASRGKARVLRPILGTTRRAEFEINLNHVYQGKENDFPLLPNDVLYVPRATTRMFLEPVGTSILTTAPYLIVSLALAGVF